ncbi:hypothetical protein A3I48_03610 [Candidatus Daviesbacteria bacterium RIFCSPLOWO2_02_FULL_36_7]|uniref:Shikimate kinase n=1 Tax=Candidatus Daviesbacteria bacterium RIFCSPLOWO2_02_FULL_36_7 TaxID=1797792 RepID=A0A1F5MFZ5_9BACT|nr:MAG: hypothetical protein A3I48_03610 [Candidatus Daviesbacteria bacterium RIFCSPLOWO2_02_FULL_36_7]
MIYWFFGYPGVGKDYLAEKLSQLVSIPHIDADNFLTNTDKKKLIEGKFTQKDRIRKLKRIVVYIKKILPKYSNLAIADSLPDNLSRKFLFDTFIANITFIYVSAPKTIHLKHLKGRKGHFFKAEMLDPWIKKHWEAIQIPYTPFKTVTGNSKILDKKLLEIYK